MHPEDSFQQTSKGFRLIPDKKYDASTVVECIKGKPYSGYFGVVILDQHKSEISRKVLWLNDFNLGERKLRIVFTAPKNGFYGLIIYRINCEVDIRSLCEFRVKKINVLTLKMVKSSEPENFVVPENYKQPEDYSIPKIDELSNEDEEILEKNLVWIFAFPRSGTQWLGTQLLRYGTQIVHGPSIGVPLGALHDDFTDNYVRQIDFRKEEAGYFFSDLYRDTWNFYLRKLILNRIYAQVRNLESKIILPDPEGSMAADIISECLPNSKIIILFRDGRDSIDSRLDSLGTNSWYVKNWKVTPISEETRMAKIYHLAKKWEIQMKILIKTLEKHPTKNSLPVKYEDLRNNTLKTLQQIYEFIGIKIPTENIKELIRLYEFENIPKEKRGPDQVTRFASPGIWKEHFNAGEIDMIEKIIGKTLRKIGYK